MTQPTNPERERTDDLRRAAEECPACGHPKLQHGKFYCTGCDVEILDGKRKGSCANGYLFEHNRRGTW